MFRFYFSINNHNFISSKDPSEQDRERREISKRCVRDGYVVVVVYGDVEEKAMSDGWKKNTKNLFLVLCIELWTAKRMLCGVNC